MLREMQGSLSAEGAVGCTVRCRRAVVAAVVDYPWDALLTHHYLGYAAYSTPVERRHMLLQTESCNTGRVDPALEDGSGARTQI